MESVKKLLILIIIIVAGLAFYKFIEWSRVEPIAPARTGNNSVLEPDPSSGTFLFDDGTITLSQGQARKEFEEITILEKVSYGDINSDNETDTALLLTRSGGGSGTFIYVAAYISGPVGHKGSNTVFLGDRIAPQNIAINNAGVITVSYLDRDPEESFSTEPTISISRQFL